MLTRSFYSTVYRWSVVLLAAMPAIAESPATQPAGELTLPFVLARLDEREHRLQNVSYAVEEKMAQVSKAGGRIPSPVSHIYTLSRARNKLRWTVRTVRAGGELESEDVSVWDGSTRRGLFTAKELQSPRGFITHSEPQSLTRVAYNNLLGLRKLGEDQPLTLPQWLRDLAAQKKNEVKIEAVQLEERSLVRVFTRSRGYDRQIFWLDPSRGHMPVRYEYGDGVQEDRPLNWERHQVEAAAEVDGLWVPTKVLRYTGTLAAPGLEGEYSYNISGFTLGHVKDSDFELDYSPGTEVVDGVRQVAYRIKADGTQEDLPLRAGERGPVRVGGQTRPATEAVTRTTGDVVVDQLGAGNGANAVATVRRGLGTDPGKTVDRLNDKWLAAFIQAKQYDAVLEFTTAGTLALPADTWRVEGLYKHRIRALVLLGRPKEALADARALFNVAGLGFTMRSLDLLGECLQAVHPEDPGIGNKFKLQVLAGAQEDAAEREQALKEVGELLLPKIEIDPKPWEKAISQREGKTEYRVMYARGNLLLLAGRTKEARELFEKIVRTAPKGEEKYAAEGLAKAIKADSGMIGPANVWIASIRPKE